MRKKLISFFLSFALLSSTTVPLSAKELENKENLSRVQTIEKLKDLSNSDLKLKEKDGQVFLSGKLATKQVAGKKSATKFLEENKLIFGIDNITDEVKVIETKKDKNGDTYIKFVQVIKGIKVEGSLINVHFDKNGVIVSVNGNFEKNKEVTTIGNERISESEAVEIAKKQYTYKTLRNTPKAERLILTKDNKNYEVFKVNVSYIEPTIGDYDVFVEAYSGKVIQTENNIRFGEVTTGSGIDVLGHNKNLNLYLDGTTYQMKDLTKAATTSIVTNTFNHRTSFGTLVSKDTKVFDTEDEKASVSAHYNSGKVIDFYKNLFNRNSLDDKGMAIKSYTHYGYNYNNAFWNGYEMVYGDGDGEIFTYLSGDLGLVGHEMTHGVISNTADFKYSNQSGALNESVADVFGVLISTYDKYSVASGGNWRFDTADWSVGGDVFTPNISGDALRSLSNPKLYDQPDNMSNYKNYPNNALGDYGGVHTNSGIPNKAAYLIAKNIGMEKTARIYYRALVNYMTADTDFELAKYCLIQAAIDLYGENSVEGTIINNAFNSVGVKPVTGVSLDRSTASLKVGDTITLVATVNPTDAINKNVTWSSSNASVAKVDSMGKVTSVGKGTAIIRVTTSDGGYTGTCTVTVNTVSTPTSVKAVATSYNGVNLSWSTVNGATGYEVYRGTSSTGPSTLISTITATSYNDTPLATNSTYYYKVRAYSMVSNVKVYGTFSIVTSSKLTNVQRLAGINRIGTSIAIAKEQYNDKAPDAVVLATANNFADALAGSGLAYKYNAPLLLVDKTVSDSKTVLNYITANLNKNKNIYILGSTGVVSKEISDYLTAQGYNIIRLGGKDRYETNQKIVNYLNTPKGKNVIITTGVNFADALSISSIAAIKGYPILLNGKDNLLTNVSNDITNMQPTTVYIIGGTGALSTNIETQIKKLNGTITIVRLGGKSRYETSIKILEHFNLNTTTIAVATGTDFPDTLSGSVLAARMNCGVLLIDKNNITKQREFITKQNITKAIVLGGEGVISKDIATSLMQN